VKEIRITFLQEEDVCLVLTEERNTGWVETSQPFPIDLEVVGNKGGGLF